jgi:hypothetical protein
MAEDPKAVAKPREPFSKELSEHVKLLFGYKDARAELRVKPPGLPTIPVKVSPERAEAIKKAFDEAFVWAMKPEEERKAGKGDIERQLDDRAKAKWGFPDGHIDLYVRPMKLAPWIPLQIDRDELLKGKPAMDEVFAWSQLPKDVREMQGVE